MAAIVTDWKEVIKAKAKRQQALETWGKEKWGSQAQHRAREKGKTPPETTEGNRMMPEKKYKATPKNVLNYQDRKKKEGTKRGKQNVPTGKKFSQK